MLRSLLLALTLAACATTAAGSGTSQAAPVEAGRAEAIFAGGCFWCVESAFQDLPGVVAAVSGYIGGPEQAPTYKQVAGHRTGHLEAVRVVYDPAAVTYEALLGVFWRNIDPTQPDGQFCDRGEQYRSAIFPIDDAQREAAEASRAAIAGKLGVALDTRVLSSAPFWEAEEYHQDFYLKNPVRYQSYRLGCGRDRRLEQIWGEAPGH